MSFRQNDLPASLGEALDRTAERLPGREAVRASGLGITYAELQRQSNNLAASLVRHGIRRGDRVAMLMEKGIPSTVALYGIMKAGAAYVPLDPFAPASRLAFVVNDCGIRVLVTTSAKAKRIGEFLDETELETVIGVAPDDELPVESVAWESITDPSTSDQADVEVSSDDLAYVLYTSGSTGVPKGIMQSHRSGLAFGAWVADEYGFRPEDRVTSYAPLHFDMSTLDYFATMFAGGTVVVVPEAVSKFPASFSKLLQDEEITVSFTVPFALIQVFERGAVESRDLSALRWVLFAGEVFPNKHLRQQMLAWPEKRFSKLFGPTETNVCTFYHVPSPPDDEDESIPIGIACPENELLVIDGQGNAVEKGARGQLCVRSPSVLIGYWGRPDLDEEYFLWMPGDDQGPFYRTGDIVREMPDGNYRYYGRADRQVKTRGYRVELDEVEAAVVGHPEVQEAAVFAVDDDQGSNQIEAAVVLSEESAVTEQQLKGYLADRIPPYAVPAEIQILGDFPRTSSGKIDRLRLARSAATGDEGAGPSDSA